MSFIRLEDAEFRALFSLIPSRVCFVYYINRVSSIFLNISNMTINYIFFYDNSCDLLCAGDLMIMAFTHDAIYFSITTYVLAFSQCPLQEQTFLFLIQVFNGKTVHLNWTLYFQHTLQKLIWARNGKLYKNVIIKSAFQVFRSPLDSFVSLYEAQRCRHLGSFSCPAQPVSGSVQQHPPCSTASSFLHSPSRPRTLSQPHCHSLHCKPPVSLDPSFLMFYRLDLSSPETRFIIGWTRFLASCHPVLTTGGNAVEAFLSWPEPDCNHELFHGPQAGHGAPGVSSCLLARSCSNCSGFSSSALVWGPSSCCRARSRLGGGPLLCRGGTWSWSFSGPVLLWRCPCPLFRGRCFSTACSCPWHCSSCQLLPQHYSAIPTRGRCGICKRTFTSEWLASHGNLDVDVTFGERSALTRPVSWIWPLAKLLLCEKKQSFWC